MEMRSYQDMAYGQLYNIQGKFQTINIAIERLMQESIF